MFHSCSEKTGPQPVHKLVKNGEKENRTPKTGIQVKEDSEQDEELQSKEKRRKTRSWHILDLFPTTIARL